MPILIGTTASYGAILHREGWRAINLDTFLYTIPATGPTGIFLHSAVPSLALLSLYFILRIDRQDRRRILLWFLIGWFGHTVADFFTHAENARPLFWPLSGWTWNSPVSYYDPLHYGREFFLISHALMLLIVAALIVRRILNYRRKPSAKSL